MPDRNVTQTQFRWIVGGLTAAFIASQYFTFQFHTDQRVRIWDRIKENDMQRQLVSVQLATLQGQVNVIVANTKTLLEISRSKDNAVSD